MKIKKIVSILVCLIPNNFLRCFLYRTLFNYKIENSLIGWGTRIVVKEFYAKNSNIGTKNYFWGPMSVKIMEKTIIGSSNVFHCGWWTLDSNGYKSNKYKRKLEIMENCLITGKHDIDVAGYFRLGSNSCIAGSDSQFWTHGASVKKNSIVIGSNCYIGSAVRFIPGAKVSDNSIVGVGSVVTKEFLEENVLIAGVPARIVKSSYNWKTRSSVNFI